MSSETSDAEPPVFTRGDVVMSDVAAAAVLRLTTAYNANRTKGEAAHTPRTYLEALLRRESIRRLGDFVDMACVTGSRGSD